MSIYISGLSLPKMPDHLEQGEEVPYIDIRIFSSGHAVISKGERPYFDEFKAIEVPPHGRLIDADAMIRDIEKAIVPNEYIRNRNSDMVVFLKQQDTIIPADKEE